jgi:hypothetical protein
MKPLTLLKIFDKRILGKSPIINGRYIIDLQNHTLKGGHFSYQKCKNPSIYKAFLCFV